MADIPGKSHLPNSVAIVAAAVLLVVMAAVSERPGDRKSGGIAGDDDTVVATIQTGEGRHSADLLSSLRASRASPQDLGLAKTAAGKLITEGRQLGDSRLVGAAIGVMRPFMNEPDSETLLLEATARQYQHDFDGALDLVDRAIGLDPRNINALLVRSTIMTVLGQLDVAVQDCRRITNLRRPQVGLLCQSTALLLTSQASAIANRLETLLARPGLLDTELEGWASGLLGEIAALQGDDATARARFEAVLSENTSALRERLLLADLMLRQDKPEEVLNLLEAAPDVDGVLIRRILAADTLNRQAVAASASEELERRFRLNQDLGLKAHAREETMYFLLIAKDYEMALARAKVNWDLQHEIEDAQLLLDAAVAAGRPGEARAVLDWVEAQDISVAQLRIPAALSVSVQ